MTSTLAEVQLHPARPQLRALTGLRFLAAIYVFFFHSGAGFMERIGAPIQVVSFLKNGYLGVSLFFILSGFILTYTYQDGIKAIGNYALARLARVYPVYLLGLAIMLPLAYQDLDTSVAIKVLAMIQAWTPYTSLVGMAWVMQAWTLSIELAFYITFPVLLLVTVRMSENLILFVASCMCALIIVWGLPAVFPGAVRPDLPEFMRRMPLPLLRLPEFFLGMLTCQLFLINKRCVTGCYRTGIVLAFLVVILVGGTNPILMGIASVLFALLIYLLSVEQSVFAGLLARQSLLTLGGASYAIYLLQGPTREWVRLTVSSASLGQVLNPVILIILAIFVFYCFEKPTRKLIIRLPRLRSSCVERARNSLQMSDDGNSV